MFVLGSKITIGNFSFSGVHHVTIRRSMHSYVDTALIQIPSICQVSKNGQALPGRLVTSQQFKDGDPVTISLGYNGDLREEFSGFVKHSSLNMPLEVECEGYSWNLRRKVVNQYWDKISAKDLMAIATDGTGITVQLQTDIPLTGVDLTDKTGADAVDFILNSSDSNMMAFFISPQVLWIGLAYTAYADNDDVLQLPQASYRLGYNCMKNNSLRPRGPDDDPSVINYLTRLPNGQKLTAISKALTQAARKYKKTLNHIKDQVSLDLLVQEKAYKHNYTGYEGNLSGFLQPFATPGYKAYITDARYPELAAVYLVESTEVNYGVSGATRTLEIGPKLGFGK
jgi:hypothetical protein